MSQRLCQNKFARVVFGLTSSLFLLNGAVHTQAEIFSKADLEFVQKVATFNFLFLSSPEES